MQEQCGGNSLKFSEQNPAYIYINICILYSTNVFHFLFWCFPSNPIHSQSARYCSFDRTMLTIFPLEIKWNRKRVFSYYTSSSSLSNTKKIIAYKYTFCIYFKLVHFPGTIHIPILLVMLIRNNSTQSPPHSSCFYFTFMHLRTFRNISLLYFVFHEFFFFFDFTNLQGNTSSRLKWINDVDANNDKIQRVI